MSSQILITLGEEEKLEKTDEKTAVKFNVRLS